MKKKKILILIVSVAFLGVIATGVYHDYKQMQEDHNEREKALSVAYDTKLDPYFRLTLSRVKK